MSWELSWSGGMSAFWMSAKSPAEQHIYKYGQRLPRCPLCNLASLLASTTELPLPSGLPRRTTHGAVPQSLSKSTTGQSSSQTTYTAT
eukprot:9200338-Alexandrium_andersonii.AAC.1